MNLVVDIGNTRCKLALFQKDILVLKKTANLTDLNKVLKSITISNQKIRQGIIATVGQKFLLEEYPVLNTIPLHFLKTTSNTPFTNHYQSPNTLGVDRIALVTAAVKKFPKQHVLVIDSGTCITYDFKTADEVYLGGAIAPGIALRYKSLHSYTANLPLLEKTNPKHLVGENTAQSIHSGIVNGITQEIDGIINEYCHIYGKTTVILTGGDADFLSKRLKNTIFAHSNFLLEGLNYLLAHNIVQ